MDWEDFWVEKLKWWLVGLAKTGALLLTLFVIGLIVEVGLWEAQEVFISITAQLVLLAFLIEVLDSWGAKRKQTLLIASNKTQRLKLAWESLVQTLKSEKIKTLFRLMIILWLIYFYLKFLFLYQLLLSK